MKKNVFMSGKHLHRLIYAGVFLAMAQVLPFVTGQIPEIGKALCPMHLPVILCGILCGIPYGAAVGFAAPLLRSLLFGVPAMNTALGMAAELLALGALSGLFRRFFPRRLPYLYLSLFLAIAGGRLMLAAAKFVINGIAGTSFSFFAYLVGNVTNALPGILLQLVAVPPLVILLEKLFPLRE
jgi:thiamine transporter ThiT